MINYKHISDSIQFYKTRGYEELEIPWLVETEINNSTMPEGNQGFQVVSQFGTQWLIGSGEQSLLQVIANGSVKIGEKPRKLMATTPCFREDPIDKLHSRHFLKTELMMVSTESLDSSHLFEVVHDADAFFKQYTETACVLQPDRTNGVNCVDIVDESTGIELGSYGMAVFGDRQFYWIYGTGCAEPRLSTVIGH